MGTYNRIEEERTINFGITRVPGIVTFEHRAFNQDDVLVCTARRNALMLRRPAGQS